MSDILTPAALAEIRDRCARTHAEWLDAEWLKDCPNAMLHAARDAHVLLAEHDKLSAEVSRLNTELKALRPGPTTPAVCRALARFWTKMAENMEASALPAGRGEDGNG